LTVVNTHSQKSHTRFTFRQHGFIQRNRHPAIHH
jgi:hypothetical protein